METKNKKYLNKEKNREYYSHSDGNFMPRENCTNAHKVLDRINWVRSWVYELGCRNVVDIGCKDGYLDLTLGSEGVECVGVDPSEDAIDEAQMRSMELNLDNVTFIKGFAEDIPEGIKSDICTCLEVIEHVVNANKLVEKLSSIGSYFAISTPDALGRHGIKDSRRNEEHVRLFKKEELEGLCSKYGNVIESVVRDDQLCILVKSFKQ